MIESRVAFTIVMPCKCNACMASEAEWLYNKLYDQRTPRLKGCLVVLPTLNKCCTVAVMIEAQKAGPSGHAGTAAKRLEPKCPAIVLTVLYSGVLVN